MYHEMERNRNATKGQTQTTNEVKRERESTTKRNFLVQVLKTNLTASCWRSRRTPSWRRSCRSNVVNLHLNDCLEEPANKRFKNFQYQFENISTLRIFYSRFSISSTLLVREVSTYIIQPLALPR